MSDRNSTAIANAVAIPVVKGNPATAANGSVLRSAAGYVANAADDADGDLFRVVRVPSNCRMSDLLLTTGDATTGGAVSIGLRYTEGDGGAEVDLDFFASDLDLTGGPFVKESVLNESTTNTSEKQSKALWDAVGLTSDPGGYFDVVIEVTTTFNGAAVGILLEALYVE